MIDEKKLIRYIKEEINPYGKPFEGTVFEFGCKVMEHIENMDKVGEWIPCSERLPEEDVDVLLCVNDEYDNAYFTVAYHHIVWQTEFGGMYGEVVAWMPLPDPYKEES